MPTPARSKGETGAVAPARARARGSLLCVTNFPSNTGYAWDFIEGLYAGLAHRFAAHGIRTIVAYPALEGFPEPLRGSPAEPVELPVRPGRPGSLWAVGRFVRTHEVRVLYLPDRPVWHPGYAWMRLLGARGIVVHDHTSGARTRPTGVKRALKRLRLRLPGTLADRVIAVSDFVAARKVEVDMVPARRVIRVWNSVELPPADPGAPRRLRAAFGITPGRPVIVCACRATPEKGVQHLLRAFDRLLREGDVGPDRPALVYMGEGPALEDLRALREGLASREDIVIAGYRRDGRELLAGADIAVVPSVWAEAFGLSVLEAMARGVPVVASRVGGIPEIIEDGASGLLVPAGDERALSGALGRLLRDPEARRRLGSEGRRRAERHFTFDREVDELFGILAPPFGLRVEEGSGPPLSDRAVAR